jgi:hypothetical protein
MGKKEGARGRLGLPVAEQGERVRPVTEGEAGAQAKEERGKEGARRLWPVVARRGRAAMRMERAGRGSERRKKGKLTSGSRLSAAPGGREGEGSRVSWCRWVGPWPAGAVFRGKKGKGRWAGASWWPMVCLRE